MGGSFNFKVMSSAHEQGGAACAHVEKMKIAKIKEMMVLSIILSPHRDIFCFIDFFNSAYPKR